MSTEIPGAIGIASHREGTNTLALGDSSHSEGEGTQAQGKSSHAEGTVTASIGESSHTEGGFTVATGQEAHAEGHGTIAKNYAQHAEGIYNKGDSLETIHETGIGTDDTDRKNAFEIYMNGAIIAPELSSDVIRNSNSKVLSTVEFLKERERNSSVTPLVGIVQLDFSDKSVNYRLDISSETTFLRPLNMIPGSSGIIEFFNQTLSDLNISFDAFWAYRLDGSYGPTEVLSGNYSKLSIGYRCIDDTTIEYDVISEYVPHLPIQVDNDVNFSNFLIINNNGDYLVS